jgi:hypothetical protein
MIIKYKGITIIESVVYLGVFAIIFVGMMQFFFMIGRSNQAVEDQVLIEKNILLITQHTNDSFVDGFSIDETSSTFDDDNGVLVINLDELGLSKITYSIENKKIQFENESTEKNSLTRTVVDVRKMRYQLIKNSDDISVGVRVEYEFFIENSNVVRGFETSYLLNKQL